MIKTISVIIFILTLISCSNDIDQINRLVEEKNIKIERASDVELIYSDSAVVQVKVLSPELIRHLDKNNPIDEFPIGIHVNFYDDYQRVSSYLDAKYALRMEKDKQIIVRDSVVFYNKKNEKLETNELIWNEKEGSITSEKFVMITRPEQGDTIMGYGIIANEDFSRFEIKRKFSSKMKFEKLSEALQSDDENPPLQN